MRCAPGMIVDDDKKGCHPADCSCTEFFNEQIKSCQACPEGLVGADNGFGCVKPESCDANQILGNMNNCYYCRDCQNGQVPSWDQKMCEHACPPYMRYADANTETFIHYFLMLD
jgi:hypothetical protein